MLHTSVDTSCCNYFNIKAGKISLDRCAAILINYFGVLPTPFALAFPQGIRFLFEFCWNIVQHTYACKVCDWFKGRGKSRTGYAFLKAFLKFSIFKNHLQHLKKLLTEFEEMKSLKTSPENCDFLCMANFAHWKLSFLQDLIFFFKQNIDSVTLLEK